MTIYPFSKPHEGGGVPSSLQLKRSRFFLPPPFQDDHEKSFYLQLKGKAYPSIFQAKKEERSFIFVKKL